MAIVQLTPQVVANLTCPPGKRHIEYCDAEVKGLMVYCTESKNSLPIYKVRVKNERGTNAYPALGTVKEITLVQARKLAKQLKAENASAPKQKAIEAPQIGSMALDAFMLEHYMPHALMHKRSAKKDEQLYRLHIAPQFKDLPLDQISRREVQAFHSALVTKGQSPASADHSIKLMRRALNLAVEWEFLDKNVLKGIKLFMLDNQVENILDDAQMQRLLAVLHSDKNRSVCLIVMFLMSTGARLNEALTATWKNINVEGGVWKVDASLSKSKRSRSIPLNDSALWVLEQLASKGVSDYLFPSPVTGRPYTAITRAWYRLRAKAGVSIRLHDLRHGFASMLVSGGRSLYEVQQILGHSDPKVTMRYAHLSAKSLQAAANEASVIVKRQALKAA